MKRRENEVGCVKLRKEELTEERKHQWKFLEENEAIRQIERRSL